MTAREYLGQAYRLEQRMKFNRDEIENLQELAISVSSSKFEEHYNATRNTDAPYIKTLMQIVELQDKMVLDLEQMVRFKAQVVEVISQLEDKDEYMILTYRYLKNYTWGMIADLLFVDERTVRRQHNKALAHVKLPENLIIL